jgi:hypothetical protein
MLLRVAPAPGLQDSDNFITTEDLASVLFPELGRAWYVRTDGGDGRSGKTWDKAKATIQDAVDNASAIDTIFIAPGEYDEQVSIPRAKSNLKLSGIGARGSVFIAPSDANAVALTNLADDIRISNVGCDGEGTGGGLLNYGKRFRAYRSKFEGGANAIILTLGSDAEITALTHGKGDDTLFEDCEIAWATLGALLKATDYGAVTQTFFKRCYFHGLPTASIEETNAGGSASIQFRGLLVDECVFGAGDEDTDALPTKWISLNDNNANSGVISRCVFPDAINGGRNLVSTALRWVSNYHTGGISTGQPS